LSISASRPAGVFFALGRLSNAEPRSLAEANELIVALKSPADGLVHHDEAIVRETLIVHLDVLFFDGLSAAISGRIVVLA
jgi:hypothetical protein